MQINEKSLIYLKEISKWTVFIGVVGFIMSALLAIFSFLLGPIVQSTYDNMGVPILIGPLMTVLYLAMSLLYFFPMLYLYRFGVQLKEAIQDESQAMLNSSLSNLKSFFKFIGIATIVTIALYVLLIIIAIIVGILSASGSFV